MIGDVIYAQLYTFTLPSPPQQQQPSYNSNGNGAGYGGSSQYSSGGGGGGGGSYGAANNSSAVVSSGNAGRIKLTGAPVSTAGFVTPQEYARTHDLQTLGDNVPQPLQTFESVGFPPDMLEEVRLPDPVVAWTATTHRFSPHTGLTPPKTRVSAAPS